MPGGKKDILETGGNASDFNAIVEGGDQPYLLELVMLIKSTTQSSHRQVILRIGIMI